MATKTCKKCGWQLSTKDPRLSCPVCKTPWTEGVCKICGEYTTNLSPTRGVCKPCRNETARDIALDYQRRLTDKSEETYAEWLKMIQQIPKPYKTLTEEQWLEACRYFDGCALCTRSHISTRAYFIPFSDGGSYCAWNIIPLCDICATALKLQKNPWRRLDKRLNSNLDLSHGDPMKHLENVVRYLQSKFEVTK